LQRLLEEADVVIMQGGPMGIIEAQRLGKKPVVIPRLSRLGEVVDDHQVAFCRLLGDEGSIHLVESSEALHRVLDAVMQDSSLGQLTPPRESNASAAAQRFRELVEGLRPRRSLQERARDALRPG
jgi:UDP-N-acetylglucosamine transferase subunit ALG13